MASRRDVLSAMRAALERRPEVLEAYVFGSFARAEEQPHSDVDAAVYVDPEAIEQSGPGLDAAITADLMQALGTNRVEVVLLNLAPPLPPRPRRRHAGRPLASLRDDLEALWAVERGLQLCAQNALDVATHLVASAGRDAPDYASAIDELAKLGILPREFADGFRPMAGFRNVLVHGYLDVDVARLHRVLNEHLDDFVEFSGHVGHHLASSAES